MPNSSTGRRTATTTPSHNRGHRHMIGCPAGLRASPCLPVSHESARHRLRSRRYAWRTDAMAILDMPTVSLNLLICSASIGTLSAGGNAAYFLTRRPVSTATWTNFWQTAFWMSASLWGTAQIGRTCMTSSGAPVMYYLDHAHATCIDPHRRHLHPAG